MTATTRAPRVAEPDPPRPGLLEGRRLPMVVIGTAVFVLVVVWVVAFSPVLGARTVVVIGNRSLTVAQVQAAADVPHGTPLIRLDTAAVRRRVEAMPDVAAASITVGYPSTVRIRITERVPVGYIDLGSGSFALVDRTGVQYRAVSASSTASATTASLPKFMLPVGASGQTTQASQATQATGRAMATVAAALSSQVLGQLSALNADSPQTITLTLRDGRTVTWGSADRSRQKAALLSALLGQPGTHFDVSNPSAAVVR